MGVRWDNNNIHGNIFSPRVNFKWNSKNNSDILRLSAGNGFRVANVFTEDQIEAYIDLKMEEVVQFEHSPHPVEFKMYYSS